MKFLYKTSCIEADGDDIREMVYAASPVTLSTIRRNCLGFSDWCKQIGYDRYLPISKDYHVGYYKSIYCGKKCYYVKWSGIEHIWVEHE